MTLNVKRTYKTTGGMLQEHGQQTEKGFVLPQREISHCHFVPVSNKDQKTSMYSPNSHIVPNPAYLVCSFGNQYGFMVVKIKVNITTEVLMPSKGAMGGKRMRCDKGITEKMNRKVNTLKPISIPFVGRAAQPKISATPEFSPTFSPRGR